MMKTTTTREGSGTYRPQLSSYDPRGFLTEEEIKSNPKKEGVNRVDTDTAAVVQVYKNAPRDAMIPTPMTLMNPSINVTRVTGKERPVHHDSDMDYWDSLLESEGLGLIESAEEADDTWDTLSLESHSSGTAAIMDGMKFMVRGNRTGSHHRQPYDHWLSVVMPAWDKARKEAAGFQTRCKRTLKAMAKLEAGKPIGSMDKILVDRATRKAREASDMPSFR